MVILGIETSSIQCSIAWCKENQIMLEYNIEKPQIHASILADLVSTGMKYLNINIKDVSLVAIAAGPGSYTGLRVGMSYCKGFCYGLDIPIIGVTNFHVLAMQAPQSDLPFVTLINANRGRYYFAKHKNRYDQIDEMGIVNEQELDKLISINSGLVVDYYSPIGLNLFSSKNVTWIQKARFNAAILCQAARKKYSHTGADDISEIEPLYLQAFAGVL